LFASERIDGVVRMEVEALLDCYIVYVLTDAVYVFLPPAIFLVVSF